MSCSVISHARQVSFRCALSGVLCFSRFDAASRESSEVQRQFISTSFVCPPCSFAVFALTSIIQYVRAQVFVSLVYLSENIQNANERLTRSVKLDDIQARRSKDGVLSAVRRSVSGVLRFFAF